MALKTKVDTEKGNQELEITRDFDLPVELLYKAYTESDFVEKWMGTKVLKLENKNHGSYKFETKNNDQIVFSANGTIHLVIPNEKIIRTFEMENSSIGVQLEFLEFQSLSTEVSRLIIRIIYQSEKHREEQLKLPFAGGLSMAHDRLQEIFEKIS